MRRTLTDGEIQAELATMDGWSVAEGAITRSWKFPSFAAGIAFVDRVAVAADAADHHPDIDIRYTKVTLRLSTHDAGGITDADVALARTIGSLSGSAPS